MSKSNDAAYKPVGEIVIYETGSGLGRVDVRLDGKKYKTKHYNLDAAISLGYRINSKVRMFASSAEEVE